MSHPRELIIQQIVTALGAGALVPVGQLYQSKVNPHESAALSSIDVSGFNETIEGNVSDAPKIYRRVLPVQVVCITKGPAAESLGNSLAEQIENILLPDHTLSGLAEDVDLVNTAITLDNQGAQLHAEIVLSFVVSYLTAHPFVVVDDFLTAYTDWDMAPPDAQIDAQDIVNLPL